ncbi:hypothetical protein AB0H83_35185 [Dactylosporangium sp. NPDC050688]|uniref:hypothetical protein n=1 Tax=Dactylosporangium sp. NPDC050688 TaxID=3157217 RepID=UPI0033F0EC46
MPVRSSPGPEPGRRRTGAEDRRARHVAPGVAWAASAASGVAEVVADPVVVLDVPASRRDTTRHA